MKKLVLVATVLMMFRSLSAQKENAAGAPYLKYPTIPPFSLIKKDSSILSRDDLARHKKTMIMYFNPGCEHCQHQTDSMIASMNKLKDVQIIMTSYEPMERMTEFYDERKLSAYSNIKMARDTKFFFVPFYRIQSLPFMALYDTKGNLITTFEGTTKIDKIAEAFNRKGKS